MLPPEVEDNRQLKKIKGGNLDENHLKKIHYFNISSFLKLPCKVRIS